MATVVGVSANEDTRAVMSSKFIATEPWGRVVCGEVSLSMVTCERRQV